MIPGPTNISRFASEADLVDFAGRNFFLGSVIVDRNLERGRRNDLPANQAVATPLAFTIDIIFLSESHGS